MKIILVKNNYKKKVKLDKGLKHLIDNTPLEYQIEEREANFPMQSRNVGNGTFSGVVADNYYDELRKIVKEGECHVVVLYYNQKMKGVRLSIAENIPLYPNTDVIQIVKDDDGLTFNHEMFHIFPKRLARQGISVYDPMDICFVKGVPKPYYNDKNINAKESNRTIALESLKPYWDKIENINTKPIVILKRGKDTGKQTMGELSVGNFRCKTLELSWKDNQPNISCIPKGEYDMKYTFSPKFMKYTYEITSVKGRSGIRIHSGNYFFQIQGCVLLGDSYSDINKDGELDILNSKKTVQSFEDMLGKLPAKLIIQ